MASIRPRLMVLAGLFALMAPALVSAQGFVIVTGDDADDGGHCQGTRCGGLYPKLFNEGLARSRSGGSGILAIGVNSSNALFAFNGWNSPANGGPGAPILHVRSTSEISTVDFNDFALVYVASASRHTSGGISNTQISALNARQPDIAAFVNERGGSLIMLTQEGAFGEWGSLPVPLATADQSFVNATPTPELQELSPFTTASNLSHCCFHNVFTGPPGFSGLEVLAVRTDTGLPVMLGGVGTILTAEICDDGVDNDDDGLIDRDDPDCRVCGDGVVDPGEECDDDNTTDGDGCSALCKVEDVLPPVALCQPVSVATDFAVCSSDVLIDAGSYDPAAAALTFSQSPASPFPPGTTSVTLTATDPGGANASCSAPVTVRDDEAPRPLCNAPAALDGAAASAAFTAAPGDNCPAGVTIAASCRNDDVDRDGVPDDTDECLDSDTREIVEIAECVTGVINVIFETGCTISDLVFICGEEARNHGDFVSCVAHLTNQLVSDDVITGREKGEIQRCAAQAPIPIPRGPSASALADGEACPVVVNGATVSFPELPTIGLLSWTVVATDGAGNSVTETCGVAVQNPDTTFVNLAPAAAAGGDQAATIGSTVALDGTGSLDLDGDPLAFSWTLTSVPPGSAAALAGPSSSGPSFVADVAGTYVAELVVSDGTEASAPDSVAVRVLNRRPAADAGSDRSVILGTEVTFDGSASSDPDGDALTFSWSLAVEPAGSAAALADADTASPRLVVDRRGVYVAQLTVHDGGLDSLIDAATVFVVNVAPEADAGLGQDVSVFDTITLDGSGSSDFEGDPLTFAWTAVSVPAGSAAALSDPAVAGPSFEADLAGVYVFELVVSDGFASSTPDTVTITTVNTPPVADAGPDQTVFTTDAVALDGSDSSDVDDDTLTFQWSFFSRPAGSAAALSDPTAVNPTFVADRFGIYNVDLVVFDGLRFSQSDRVAVVTANSPPVADAGADQDGFVNDTITLDGSGSSDVDGQALTYAWSFASRPAGSSAVLSNPTAVTPSFTIDRKGPYVVELVVSDGNLQSAPDTVTVTTRNTAPVADAGPDQTAFVTGTVTLDGSGSSDVDLDSLSFSWSLSSVPAGSAAALSDPSAVAPSFTIDLPGTYVAQLVVHDGEDDSAPDSVTIVILNSPPVAEADADQTLLLGSTARLDGSGSFDVDGDPLAFTWTLLSAPGGSAAALSDPASPRPSFVTDLPGAYVAQLVVDDGTVASAPDTVTITTANVAPVAAAGPDQTVSVTDLVELDGSGSSDADGDPLTFAWSFLSRPSGSSAALSDPSSPQPSFLADRRGTYVVQLVARDSGGAESVPDGVSVLSAGPPPPTIGIAAPETGFVTAGDSVDVTGTVTGLVGSVDVNGVAAAVASGTFTASGVPLAEGTNILVATALNAADESASAAVSVRRDTDPPLAVIESPRDGDRLITETVTVAGTVNDIIPGATVNEDDVTVTVNGIAAAVMNRTFMLPDLPLAPGVNTITATAVDRAGNSRSASIAVSREPDLVGIRVVPVAGNNQSAPIESLLPVPLTVRLETADGTPLAGRPVELAVSRGDGLLGDPLDARRQVTLLSDAAGEASVGFTLGSRTAEGAHRVRVTTPGSLTFAEFCATAEAGVPVTLSVAMAPAARGVVAQRLAEPLSAIVTDAGGNPVAGVPVTFQVDFGGGSFEGEETAVVATDPDGIAKAFWTLGPDPGRGNHRASATFAGNPGAPAAFVLSGVATGPAAQTKVSGLVQDSTGRPIEDARTVLRGTGLEARTGADGRFTIEDVPPGGHRVGVLGSTASRPGVAFPDIDFAVEATSGADNELDQIVVLPFLDTPGARVVGGGQDVVLDMAGVDGFAIKVFAGSVILPDGTRGEALMSSSQVKFDKVPMAPPQGATPLVVGTLQPAGIRFDPPAQVIYPNVEGLAPGDVADIFAFHHDIGQFVNVGPGTVSEDGSVVVSDPGFGLVQSGWNCLVRFPGQASSCANGCSVDLEWRPVRRDGSFATTAQTDGPVWLTTTTPSNRARVRTTFTPPDGSFAPGGWSGGGAVAALSDESTGANTTEVTLESIGLGVTNVTSPNYQFKKESCRAEIEVKTIDFFIREVLSDQFPGRTCNMLPPAANPARNRPMMMGAVSGRDARTAFEVQVNPASEIGRIRVGMRQTGTTAILGEAAATASVDFTADDGRNLYQFVAGLDVDSDGVLVEEEVGEVFADEVRVITQNDVNDARANVELQAFGLVGIAQELVDVFLGTTPAPPDATAARTHRLPSTDPTHPVGALWDPSCHADVARFEFDETSAVAEEIAEACPVLDRLELALRTHQSDIEAFFAAPGSPDVAVFPAALSQTWNWVGGVTTTQWGIPNIGIALAFGAVDFQGEILEVEIERDLTIHRIVFVGEFQDLDLYDFDFHNLVLGTPLCREASIVQTGFGTLGAAGRIFVSHLDFRHESERSIFGPVGRSICPISFN